jgi:tetratricopeptide (TPR) repeat protein
VRAEHAKADALVGPRYLIQPVQSQLPLVNRLCQAARGPERNGFLFIASRFAEFCGWLYQDLGHADSALYWTNYALDYAYELGDEQLIAYSLHRKSNIVTEAGSPGHGLGLANAAFMASDSLPPHTRAVALRQQARAHALLSEPSEFRRGIDKALAYASQEDSDGIDNPARYCTPSYVEMEAGISWVKLGKPDMATNVFRESLRVWPEGQTRDRGLCLARLATALAMEGDTDEACKAAAEALAVAHSTGSARIRSQLGDCVESLKPLATHPAVRELERQLGDFASR